MNSSGEKHGWFKGYDREAIVVYEYNYKNGLWNGVNKEYSVYGGRKLAQTETYKDGVGLVAEASIIDMSGYLSVLVAIIFLFD